jgi:predicted nuclease of predicted toxin-antitoxin system
MSMKFLLDTCVDRRVAEVLLEHGHEVERVALWAQDPGDAEILRIAAAGKQILVTRDKDFGTLAVLLHQQHAGIIRLTAMQAEQQPEAIIKVVGELGEELSNLIVVAYPLTYRTR